MDLTTLQKTIAIITGAAIVIALACPWGSQYSMQKANGVRGFGSLPQSSWNP